MTIYSRQNCLFPHLVPSTAYQKKCRCDACLHAKSDRAKMHYLKNKDHIDTRSKSNQKKKPEHYKQYRAEYYVKNTDKMKKCAKVYRKLNKQKRNMNHLIRLKADPIYALKCTIRGRLYSALRCRRMPKTKQTMVLLGCSIEHLKTHIESKFKDGMTWENKGRGGWHIDHIIPLAFAGSNIDTIYELCHFTNLQPLWESENLSKGSKIL